ncbi:MAG TPA: roadblock/LC7 domain-containing protein [Methanoregulaceae archaeon]|nr:roadblock/LC7 domain-containing protein [Methanoregulaceae archaeon]
MLKEKIKGYIEKIDAVEGIIACALISRDGIMLGNGISGEFNEPWFAAMTATLFASAESATSIIKAASPEVVTIGGGDSTLVVMGAGEKILIVAVLNRRHERTHAMDSLEIISREIGGSF